MNKIKIIFSDICIEIDSADETTDEISNRAMNGLSFLIQERLKFDELTPGDVDDHGTIPGAHVVEPAERILPDVLRAYG